MCLDTYARAACGDALQLFVTCSIAAQTPCLVMQGAALAKAKLMTPSLSEQYQIFKLEQMEMERMALENNDNTMDMAGYAEFQRQFKSLKEAHKQVLYAIRAFWQALARTDVKYLTLVHHFKSVEQSQSLVSDFASCQ